MNPTTPRFNNDLERRTYEQGLALVKRKIAKAHTEAQHRIVAARLGTSPEVIASVVRSAVADTLRTFAAKQAVATVKPPVRVNLARRTAPTPAAKPSRGTLHRFCCGPIFG